MNKDILIYLSILILITCSCSNELHLKEILFAKVGETDIKSTDLEYRLKVQKTYGREEDKISALVEMMYEALEYEVAKLHNQQPNQKELEELEEHADKTSKAPEILKRLKEIFADNKQSFYRHILSPRLTNAKLHKFYATNKEIHKKEREKIEKAWEKVWKGGVWEEIAKDVGAEYLKFEVAKKIEIPDVLKDVSSQDTELPLFKVVKELKDKEVYRNIVEDDYSFQIIRRIREGERGIEVEGLVVKKRLYDDWFKEQAKKVKIEIKDAALKEEVKKRYKDVWWLDGLFKF